MDWYDDPVLLAADLASEALAMNDAALRRDFNNARCRAQAIVHKAFRAERVDIAAMAARVHHALASAEGASPHGYGPVMLELAQLIGDIVDMPAARRART